MLCKFEEKWVFLLIWFQDIAMKGVFYLKTMDYLLMGTVYQLRSKDHNSHRQHQVIVKPDTFRSCELITKIHHLEYLRSTRIPCLYLRMGRLDRWDPVLQPCYWHR